MGKIISVFSYQPLIETITLIIFSEKSSKKIKNLIGNPIKLPFSYSFKWKFTNFWDDFPELFSKQAKFNFSKIYPENDKKEEFEIINLNTFEKTVTEKTSVIKAFEGFKSSLFQTGNYLNIWNYYLRRDNDKFQHEQKLLTKALGIPTYYVYFKDNDEILYQSPLFLFEEFYEDILLKNVDSDKYEPNEFKDLIFNFTKVYFISD